LGVPANVVAVWLQPGGLTAPTDPVIEPLTSRFSGAPRGIRTPDRRIRRLVLYVHAVRLSAVCAAQVGCRIQLDRQSPVWSWLVDCHADCHDNRLQCGTHLAHWCRHAGRMIVRDLLEALQVLPRDAELLAFEAEL
jgi:hypothetical protein